MERTDDLNRTNNSQEQNDAGEAVAVQAERASTPDSRRNFMRKVLGATAGIAFAELAGTPDAQAQLGSKPFANPPELAYRAAEKRLRGVMELFSGDFSIPNL